MIVCNQGTGSDQHRQLHVLPSSVNEVVEQRLDEIVCDCYRCSCGGVQAWTIDRDGFVQVRHVTPPDQGG